MHDNFCVMKIKEDYSLLDNNAVRPVICDVWVSILLTRGTHLHDYIISLINKGNNKITELRTILQRESQNS
jgi:hypothetical protein